MPSNKPIQKERLNWVDQTKGLAILGIVLFHFFQNYPDRIHLVSLLDRNGARVGFAAVDIFFVMAGFNTSYVLALLSQKKQLNTISTNWKSWLIKRIDRIYIPYILAVLSSLLLYHFVRVKINPDFNFFLSVLGLAGFKFQAINPGFWFFTVILQAYLVIPIIFYLCRSNPQKILFLGILVGVFNKLACLLIGKSSYFYGYFLQNNFLGSYFFPLCLGLYWGIIYFENKSFRKKDYTLTTAVFVMGIFLYSFLLIQKISIIYMLGFDILFTPFLFIVCYLIFENLRKYEDRLGYVLMIFSWLGIYSYQIYLIHQPLFFVLLPRLMKTIDTEPYLKIMISLIITICLLTIYVFSFTSLEVFLRKLVKKAANQQA